MSKSRDEYYVFFLETVRKYIDNIIRTSYKTADVGGIFADGIEIESGKHVRWNFPDGESVAISDIANEQNLLRTLVGLSNLTGEGCYKQYACDALRHIFSLQHSCGLLEWGGHRFIDYDTMKIVGIKEKKGDVHELKNCFPYYELMYEVDREATEKYIEAFWNAHVYRWPRHPRRTAVGS